MDESLSTVKYVIKCTFNVSGVVEKPDVVGAIFGQLEGLLGKELDLRELQRTGRIGRIEVSIKSKGGKTNGVITIPSSLDKIETALIAAATEMIDKIGPCTAQIKLDSIEDIRHEKRTKIKRRAIEILEEWSKRETEEIENLLSEIEKSIRTREITSYGPEKLPAGPEVEESEEIIIVEGRADVINLLRHGIRNAMAVEGTNIPKTVQELSKRKKVTAFLDGDRGGELILKELIQVADVDYVAFAPPGRMVEELTEKEIMNSLKGRVLLNQYLSQKGKTSIYAKATLKPERKPSQNAKMLRLISLIKEVTGKLRAYCLDSNLDILSEANVEDFSEIEKKISNTKPYILLIDGLITQRLIDEAAKYNTKMIIGVKRGDINKIPYPMKIYTFEDILSKEVRIP